MKIPTRARPALIAAALYSAANGYVHAEQWVHGYRHIPSSVAGSWVVRDGFPLAAISAVVVALAMLVALRLPRVAKPVLLGGVALHVGSLVALILTRTSSLFGWSEPTWTLGANQARATEIGALMMIGLTVVLLRVAAPTLIPAVAKRPVPATRG